MKVEQFNKRTRNKKEYLVILDDLVLDVADYMEEHPGELFS
jgi:cytochrome b involved in lipid metabolism